MMSVLLRFSCPMRRRCYRVVENHLARSYTSALFIPGNKASEAFALLSPFLDFDDRFADLDRLRRELELRGTKIDAPELARVWQYYKYIDSNKWALEVKRSEIAHRMKQLNKKKTLSCEEESEKTQLKIQGKVLKQDMRIIKEALWEMEESVVVRALKLPNVIHEKTPSDTATILSQHGDISEQMPNETKSHIEIGASLGLIDYKNPLNYYLCEEAALFELGALSYAGRHLADAEMMRISGTDFSRSLVVEGSGLNHEDRSEVFFLENNEGIDSETCNRLHLVGGASLVSFLTMHTKQLINPKDFPLRYFATGRQYTPFVEGTQANGLFTICQSSAVHTFAMAKDPTSDEYKSLYENLANVFGIFYDSLDIHYRTVLRSANELKPWESLRVSYEMWSAFSRQYIEIGHLSICGQYFSKRLLIAYQTPTGRGFPAIISGTVISIPKLLGCLLEENPKKFRIPTKIAEHMPGFN